MGEIIELIKDMVSNGDAPEHGCSLFGVGYEEAFERLEKEILLKRMAELGRSAEKFIVGPYGSGKSHFMNQFIEMGRDNNFVTSEVQLSSDVNIAESIIVFSEITRNIAAPNQKIPGIRGLIKAAIEMARSKAEDPERSDEFIELWLSRLKDEVPFESNPYQRVLLNSLHAHINGEEQKLENGCRWLSGEVKNSKLCKELDVAPITKKESNRFAETALFSLCRFIKESEFAGSIIGYDEAEQSADVSKSKLVAILSLLRTELTAITKIKGAAILKVYAFTPEVIDEMKDYPALQQRVSDPNPEKDFFSGETYASLIDVTRPFNDSVKSLENLQAIGKRLVDLFCDAYGSKLSTPSNDILRSSQLWAEKCVEENPAISSRRDMVKLCCSNLIDIYENEIEGRAESQGKSHNSKETEEEV